MRLAKVFTISAAACITMFAPGIAKSSVHADLNENTYYAVNDNDCSEYITKGGTTKRFTENTPQWVCWPLPGFEKGKSIKEYMTDELRREVEHNWNTE